VNTLISMNKIMIMTKTLSTYISTSTSHRYIQAHFDELNEFLLKFSNPPSIMFISETCIDINLLINVDIPGYDIVHFSSPTKVGGVGAYISNKQKFL